MVLWFRLCNRLSRSRTLRNFPDGLRNVTVSINRSFDCGIKALLVFILRDCFPGSLISPFGLTGRCTP